MSDTPDTLLARMDRLLELTELARQAVPDDRARIRHYIELAGRVLLAVAQAWDAADCACRLSDRTDVDLADRRRELAALLAKLRTTLGDSSP